MAANQILQIFAEYPQVLYGFAPNIGKNAKEFRSVFAFAVPYGKQLTLETYTEDGFKEGIQIAQNMVIELLKKLEQILEELHIHYWIPPAVQSNETELLAPVSFKAAAVQAGLGWMGKNDVLITKEYGPRVCLYAVLIDELFEYGIPSLRSLCPVSCNLCADACPVHAVQGVHWSRNCERSDLINYQLCNQTRSRVLAQQGEKSTCGLCMAACPVGT